MKIIRVAIADDHPLLLAGLGMLIRAEADLEIVAEAASGPQALQLIRESTPDIAVIDISLPHMNGILLARQLMADFPSMGVIVLTQHEDRVYLFATGFTVKEIACRLDLSLSSIETYKTRAADKLSIKGRAEIVRYASAQGWLASV
jgi:DNA-binding NarL/FixJ family response regulator